MTTAVSHNGCPQPSDVLHILAASLDVLGTSKLLMTFPNALESTHCSVSLPRPCVTSVDQQSAFHVWAKAAQSKEIDVSLLMTPVSL